MAKITKSATAPSDARHFQLANFSFDLSGTTPYETTNSELITLANAHSWLDVERDPAEITPPDAKPVDPNDPSNPENDALSVYASPATIAAAKANQEAISEAAGVAFQDVGPNPTIAEHLADSFTAIGIVAEAPQVPQAETAPAAPAAPDVPVAEPTADSKTSPTTTSGATS